MDGPIDVAALRRLHARFLRDHERMVEEVLSDAGAFARDHVRRRSDFVQRHFGSPDASLKTATKSRFVRLASGRLVAIESPKTYASYIDGGTRHIRPRWFLRNAQQAAFEYLGQQLERRLAVLERRFNELQ